MLARLASACFRRRRLVVAAWVAALLVAGTLSATAGGEHRVDYAMPGSGSAAVRDLLAERFPERSGDLAYMVIRSTDGFESATVQARIDELTAELRAAERVASVDPIVHALDGVTALVPIQFDAPAEHLQRADIEHVIEIITSASSADLQLEAGGWPVQAVETGEGGSEQIGLVAALLILLLAFGSALAAGIPIVMALFGVGIGGSLAMLVANVLMVPDWGSQLAAMIGIGVGIDYALFIVTRHRAAMDAGEAPAMAVVTAITTAGRAVLFAGGTVVISLLGLGAMGLEYMWGAAVAMVLAVLAVLTAAVTLLPAALGFAGDRIDRFRVPFVRGATRSERWASWSRRVQRRPIVAAAAGVGVLLVLAAPLTGIRFGIPDASSGPESLTSRRAHDLVAESFGPGANGPLVVTLDSAPTAPGFVHEAVAVATERIGDDPGVAAVLPAEIDGAGSTAVLTVVPATGPQDDATEALVDRLRHEVLPAVEEHGATGEVGGFTALDIDEARYESARLPWFIAVVLVLSFALLLVVFRSILVALKAALLNLLGIAAAYGVIAHAAEGGWFGDLVGISEPTTVPVFVMILMFAVLFGLSMDYEVFLLSRIREEHLAGRTNSEAVVEGIASTARVITAAAAIMVVVFGAFILNDLAFMKMAGLGLATAVLLDATVVRMLLVPATMELLGERNWWIPRWLDRVLPRVEIEARRPIPAQPVPVPVPAAEPEVVAPEREVALVR